MTTLYTLGHSGHSLDHFLGLLGQHEVTAVADVRSQPYSKWAPHFCKDPLSAALAGVGVEYVFLGAELGGRPDGAAFYDVRGRLDLERRAAAPDFLAGIERLLAIAASHRPVILCAEEDPGRCHRHALVAPALQRRHAEVVHIRGDGRLQPAGEVRGASRQLALLE